MQNEGGDGLDPARGCCLGVAVMLVVVAAVVVLFVLGCPNRAGAATIRNELALAECRLIVTECYPNSGFYPWCGTLIAEHERYADLKGAPDFAAHWYWSLVYAGANVQLKVGASFPEGCAGPMDVKHYPRILEPGANIRWHVREAYLGYSKGYRGICNAEYVMKPSAPRDWGGGKFRKTDARHREVIREAYRERRLP